MDQDDRMVNSNSYDSTPYTFDELEDAFDDLILEFETMRMKYSKMISKTED